MDQNNSINNSAINQVSGKLRVFCCGGAGIGIGKYFEEERKNDSPGYASLHPVYMDTSEASTYGVPEDNFYKLPESKGSGGVRALNGPDIVKYTGEILQKFPAFEHNVVIHSTTGGSGSVLAPSIVSELLNQGKSVIVFAIGGDDTKQYILNSKNTLLSYDNIVRVRNKPVVLQYLQNGIDGTIEEVDAKVHVAISCLSVLYSGQNKNLDERDLQHWLHFEQVTSYEPQIGVFSIHQQKLNLKDTHLISVATLNSDLNNTRLDQPVEYQRVGVPMTMVTDDAKLMYPLHFAIADGFVDTIMKKLDAQIADYETKEAHRVVRNKLSTGNERVTSNGLVF